MLRALCFRAFAHLNTSLAYLSLGRTKWWSSKSWLYIRWCFCILIEVKGPKLKIGGDICIHSMSSVYPILV